MVLVPELIVQTVLTRDAFWARVFSLSIQYRSFVGEWCVGDWVRCCREESDGENIGAIGSWVAPLLCPKAISR